MTYKSFVPPTTASLKRTTRYGFVCVSPCYNALSSHKQEELETLHKSTCPLTKLQSAEDTLKTAMDSLDRLRAEFTVQSSGLALHRTCLEEVSRERDQLLVSGDALHKELRELKEIFSQNLAVRDAEIVRLKETVAQRDGITVLVPMKVIAALEADKMTTPRPPSPGPPMVHAISPSPLRLPACDLGQSRNKLLPSARCPSWV